MRRMRMGGLRYIMHALRCGGFAFLSSVVS